jgi:hypothetical protein
MSSDFAVIAVFKSPSLRFSPDAHLLGVRLATRVVDLTTGRDFEC